MEQSESSGEEVAATKNLSSSAADAGADHLSADADAGAEHLDADAGAEHLSADADAGADHLSALPDDVLLLILGQLGNVAAAARTSVLSRRWRRTWTLLPVLVFESTTPEDLHIREALEASEALAILHIHVVTRHDTPDSVAAWLPLAAPRLYGTILYFNDPVERRDNSDEAEEENGATTIALPCFENAIEIDLNLGFLPLSLPSSGVFARLTDLFLNRVRFRGSCELGDVVSRSPCLRMLSVEDARGVVKLTVHSNSLWHIRMRALIGLQQISIDASVLQELAICDCFCENDPVANISAPNLMSLLWWEWYDPRDVQLGDLGQLQLLSANVIKVYGDFEGDNLEVLMFLQQFQVIHTLHLLLVIPQGISNLKYLMKEIVYLPRVTFLTINLLNRGHHFGPCLFHLLRLCTGIRSLSLVLRSNYNLEAQSTCPSNCKCGEPSNWEIVELNYLQEVEITDLIGAEHEVDFLKRLFDWAVVLEKLRVTFDSSVGVSEAKELAQRISSMCRPEIHKYFCVYRKNPGPSSVELLPPEDEGTGV